MATITHHQTLHTDITLSAGKQGRMERFITWCDGEEKERLFWTGFSLGIHGCVITPLAFLSALIMGNSFPLVITSMFAMVAVLVVNLAAMPTRITIPVFIASVIVDLAIVATSLFAFLNG